MSPEASREQRPESPLPVAKSLDPPAPPAVKDPGRAAVAAPPDVVGDADGTSPLLSGHIRWTFRETASFLVSLVLHVALLLTLSLLVVFTPPADELTLIVNTQPSEGLGNEESDAAQPRSAGTGNSSDAVTLEPLEVGSAMSLPASRILYGPSEATPVVGPGTDSSSASLILRGSGPAGGGFEGRRGEGKGELLASGGGTPASESAVALGLAWLAAHQWRDGGWRLDLTAGPCGGQCQNSGSVGTTTAATGLALLPFLGAGQTHMEGEYRDVVYAGVYYLKDHSVPTPHGADLQEGTMYAQGIATIALCEAYGMTKDESLRQPAQRAVDFICWAQHSAGGWRYYPGQPGDTTVLGWQMMALKSASMAGLDVPSPVVMLAERFLDSVQSGGGAYYGYITPAKSTGPTAVGLLIRMYTGWDHYDPRLQRGVAFLANEGPSKTDMYFNYYATQVLHHYGGPAWTAWNNQMRDHLVRSQAATGHERGSWFFNDQYGVKGGRLYTTAMCTMILEVYYRHMPLYEKSAVDDGL
jgi:hypothetical protein